METLLELNKKKKKKKEDKKKSNLGLLGTTSEEMINTTVPGSQEETKPSTQVSLFEKAAGNKKSGDTASSPSIAGTDTKIQEKRKELEESARTIANPVAREKFNQQREKLEDYYNKNKDNLNNAEVADRITQGFLQIAAGLYGLKKGVDVSGAKFSTGDWSKKIDDLFKERDAKMGEIDLSESKAEQDVDREQKGLDTEYKDRLGRLKGQMSSLGAQRDNLEQDRAFDASREDRDAADQRAEANQGLQREQFEFNKQRANRQDSLAEQKAAREEADKAPKISKAQETIDKEFGKEYAKFALQDKSKLERNLSNIEDAITRLGKTDMATGPIISLLPDAVRKRAFKEGWNAQQAIETVTQQSLKAILGGQFAQKEAEMLFARQFDPSQDEAENVRRAESLQNQLSQVIEAKKDAAEYFETNGTMAGFNKETLDKAKSTVSDIESRMEAGAGSSSLSTEDQQALDWANSNPEDPRAKQIKERLGR